ncbi:hypothetical protein AOB57_002785 [Methanosarcina flavescens]|jgi:hypothetical protein|uniref:Uncharacterized protein n=1 Tax=Methanosarcina flavescens TaxID=1715806 RepID=A0A660HPS9_9EURY|nr:hypothetical protein AOB57_002785 [Methanosarcina flavescens]
MFLPGIVCILNPLFEKFYPPLSFSNSYPDEKINTIGMEKDFIRKDNEQYNSRRVRKVYKRFNTYISYKKSYPGYKTQTQILKLVFEDLRKTSVKISVTSQFLAGLRKDS